MTVHLQRQIALIKKYFLELGDLVEHIVTGAVRCALTRDEKLARRVIASDERIDQMEVDIEEECLKALALHQPVAFDLRFVVAILKINNDLERIADLATNIADQAIFLSALEKLDEIPYDLELMSSTVGFMFTRVLNAVVHVDTDLARTIVKDDDIVDAIHKEMYENVERAIRKNGEQTPQLIHMMNISRQLERIADLTVNIAEDILYLAEGKIYRHQQIQDK